MPERGKQSVCRKSEQDRRVLIQTQCNKAPHLYADTLITQHLTTLDRTQGLLEGFLVSHRWDVVSLPGAKNMDPVK